MPEESSMSLRLLIRAPAPPFSARADAATASGGARQGRGIGARLAWCLAGPAFERVRKRTDFPISEQPRKFGDRQRLLRQITLCEIESQACTEAGNGQALHGEPPCECPLADAEAARDVAGPGLAMRQERNNGVLDARTE